MNSLEFLAWLERMGWSDAEAAAQLRVDRARVFRWRKPQHEVAGPCHPISSGCASCWRPWHGSASRTPEPLPQPRPEPTTTHRPTFQMLANRRRLPRPSSCTT